MIHSTCTAQSTDTVLYLNILLYDIIHHLYHEYRYSITMNADPSTHQYYDQHT